MINWLAETFPSNTTAWFGVERGVYSSGFHGSPLTLHIGETVFRFGKWRRGFTGRRLELFTKFARVRWTA